MSWKPSKRQARLKKRLLDSSQVYWNTSHELDQMLLKMLHSNGIYTPDDFYNRYVRQTRFSHQNAPISPVRLRGQVSRQQTASDINRTLMNLSKVLVQLKDVISKMHN